MSGIVIGARTGSEGGGGSYSVFYNAAPFGEAFTEAAWVDGLQQNQENRSNLALVNTGEVDGSASVFHLEIYDGETGLLAETVVTKPIPPGAGIRSTASWAATPRRPGRGISASRRCRGQPLPGLRGGQRRRRSGRAQRRRSLPAGSGVGDQQRSVTECSCRVVHFLRSKGTWYPDPLLHLTSEEACAR